MAQQQTLQAFLFVQSAQNHVFIKLVQSFWFYQQISHLIQMDGKHQGSLDLLLTSAPEQKINMMNSIRT